MTGMTASIYVTLGNKRYVGGYVNADTDISGGTFTIALGTDPTIPPAAAAFTTPGVNMTGAALTQRKVLKLIDNTITPGTYFVWVKIVDVPGPEIEPLLVQGPVTVI